MCSTPQHAAVFAAASCSCCPTTTTVPTESKLPPQRVNPYIFIDGWTPRATALDLEAGAEIPSTVVQYLAKTAAMGHGCRTAAARERGVKGLSSRTTTKGRRAAGCVVTVPPPQLSNLRTSAVRTAELLLKSLKDTRLDGPKTSSFRAAQSIGNYSILYSSSAQ